MIPALVTETTTGDLTIAAALFSVALALVHLVSGRWQFAGPDLLRRLLSFAGGASVAYVFVLLLPEVSEAALAVGTMEGTAFLAEQRVYEATLLGFVVFYGVEVFVTQRRGKDVETSSLVFWGHIVVFSIYSGLIGYLLFHQEVETVFNLFYYALAMALHFSVTDYGLRQHHGETYYRIGRWMLAGSTLVGGVIGFYGELDPLPLSMLTGFLAGAIVLNIIKEELPDIDESRFGAFAVGTIVYTLLIALM